MIDTLMANVDRARNQPVLHELGLEADGYGLLTLHRPSNVDDPAVLAGLIEAVNKIAVELPIVFPAHPRTISQLPAGGLHPQVVMIEPRGYLDFLAL